MDASTFETRLLAVMAFFALILVACLASLAFSRWRRRSPFRSEAFRSAHVQPTQKAAPTVATLIEHKTDGRDHSADHNRQARFQSRQWERQTNHGMY